MQRGAVLLESHDLEGYKVVDKDTDIVPVRSSVRIVTTAQGKLLLL